MSNFEVWVNRIVTIVTAVIVAVQTIISNLPHQ